MVCCNLFDLVDTMIAIRGSIIDGYNWIIVFTEWNLFGFINGFVDGN